MGCPEKVLQDVLQALRLRPLHEDWPLWPKITLLVSIDLEVSGRERRSYRTRRSLPFIRELGIATLDTRHIFMPATWSPPGSRLIETHQFSTTQASSDFEDCDVSDFRECEFAETFCLAQNEIVLALDHFIRASCPDHVVLIGHSIQQDLAILRASGFNDKGMTIIDTHELAHEIFGKIDNKPAHFTLGGLLSHMQYPFTRHELHNAGNDATFTLHAMLGIALMHEETSNRQGISEKERGNLHLLRLFIEREVRHGRRWKPIRRALGAYMTEDDL
jgi:hypothetical protein